MKSTAKIFFSYAWAGPGDAGENREDIVNRLYQSLSDDGYQLVRDKTNLGYKGMISEFMRRIGKGNYIVVVISDKYLKSPNCMFELLEIYRNSESDVKKMRKKIFPVVLSDAKIYKPEDILDYVTFWKNKKEELNKKIAEAGLEYAAAIVEDFTLYKEISNNIAVLSKLLKDMNALNPAMLSAENFLEVKKAIGSLVVRKAPAGGVPAVSKQGLYYESPLAGSILVNNDIQFKVAAFDLDGTLLRAENFEYSWTLLWQSLNFGKAIHTQLKLEYQKNVEADGSQENRIKAYQTWCDKACEYYKRRKLTRTKIKDLCAPLALTNNCKAALKQLRDQHVVTAIISGGINTFLEDIFPDFREYFDFVFINEMLFSADGLLDRVEASHYDFRGKADAIEYICQKVLCDPKEVVFVGDHYNDLLGMYKVDRAIAYPPRDAQVEDTCYKSIREDDLLLVTKEILPG